jgi:selenide,water dikinase
MAMTHRLGREARVTLVERGPDIARELPSNARSRLRRALDAQGVSVRTDTEATAVDAGGVRTRGNGRIEAAFVTAAVGARPAPWLAESGLAVTPAGFVEVDAHLRARRHGHVFAAGDVAHLADPRPKAGVFAVRQGPVLHAALTATLAGRELPTYAPQADYLRLISLGARRALAVKYGRAVGGTGPLGALLWRLKDRIDRKFMATVDVGA